MHHMLNSGHHTTILSKIRTILIKAQDKADAEEWGYKDTGRDIPQMGIRLSVPKIYGQDTTFFSGWTSFMQHRQKNFRLPNASMFDTKPPDIANMSNYFRRHVNYLSTVGW